jgi:hypothetical protein
VNDEGGAHGEKISDIRDQRSGTRKAGQGSDEEIEKEEKGTEKDEKCAKGEVALRELGDGIQKAGGNDAKPRLPAGLVKRASGNVAGKISAQE